jgi:beta-galactosidase/beta-glucuronidase
MIAVMAFAGQTVTRGVGVYPGNPAEGIAPLPVPDQTNYRNLALLRPAYHASSCHYNLTAQLVTDGINWKAEVFLNGERLGRIEGRRMRGRFDITNRIRPKVKNALANPVDSPEPSDNDLFLRNAKDFIQRIRNHPSVCLYCGCNEGDPPEPIDDGIRKMMPGERRTLQIQVEEADTRGQQPRIAVEGLNVGQ